ncbi:MAG: T9SS type A sorting domain-containing protein [Saprospiraceae bacterium]
MRRLLYLLPLALFSLLSLRVSATSTDSIPPISLDELVGINFWWDNYGKHLTNTGGENADQIRNELEQADFFRKLNAVGFVREFHDWYVHEGINAECGVSSESPSPLYPDSKYKFRVPYQYQASGINHDVFYECLLNEMGENYCVDMLRSTSELVKNYVGTTCGAEEKLERLPVNGNNKFDSPESYEEYAAYLYQFAYRYGSRTNGMNSEDQIRENLHPDSHASFDYTNTKVGSVTSVPLRYIEVWNEPDQWWREAHIPETYIEPQEFAAMLSAAGDGHEGTLRHAKQDYPLGIKNADPNAKVVMGGLAELNPCYAEEMLDWMKQQRQDVTQLPFDVVNYHHYSRNGGVGKTIEDYCAGGALANARWDYGVSPEEDGLKVKLRMLRERLELHTPQLANMEFWLSEFGYETHLGSPQAAIPVRDPITGEDNFRQNLDNYRNLWTNPVFDVANKNVIRETLELTQAQWLLRTYLEVAASGWQRAVAYEFGDRVPPSDYDHMGWNSVANRGEFPLFQTSGLFYFDPSMPPAKRYQPKMSYFYVKSFKTVLTDYQYVTEERFPNINESCNDALAADCPRIYQFKKQDDEILRALWLPTSEGATREIVLPLAENTLTAELITLKDNDEDGVISELKIENGKVKITLSETPIFIRTTLELKPICEIGNPCDDGDACTDNDVFVNEDCLCEGTFADSDNDGICNAEDDCVGQTGDSCDDGNACTVDDKLDADCNCVGTIADSDNDGICDADDDCDGQVGDLCNDQDPCTINDKLDADCNCVGTFADADNDGICDAEDNCEGQVGDLCNDQDPCTINDKLDADCNCVGTFADADEDGICDAEDNCMGTTGDLCNDQDPCTINDKLDADCNCIGTFADADNDGICDAEDNCMGSTCDDGNACTNNDRLDENCNCIGDVVENCGDGENGGEGENEGEEEQNYCSELKMMLTEAGVMLNGLTSPIVIVKSFSPTWQLEFECNGFADENCPDGMIIPLESGLHNLQVQFFDTDGQQICIRDGIVTIESLEVENEEEETEEEETCELVGQTCDDNDGCTRSDMYNADCECIGMPIEDSDNDGVCDAQDICAGSDDNLDTNGDGAPDGCEEQEEEVTEADLDCNNIQLKTDYFFLQISGMTGPTVVAKVFDPDWNTVYMCSDYTDNPCPLSVDLDIAPGAYFVQVQFYDQAGDLYCLRDGGVFIPRGVQRDVNSIDQQINEMVSQEIVKEETKTTEVEEEVPAVTIAPLATHPQTNVESTTAAVANCNFVGQFCDDGDPCTTNDRYDADCNCAGETADSDRDGICDVEDICPGGNDRHDRDGDGIPDACDPVNCDDIEVTTAIQQIEIANLEAPGMIVKVFNDKFKTVYECTNLDSEVCEDVQLVELEKGGVYYVEVQYFDENQAPLCRGEFGVNVPTEEVVEVDQDVSLPGFDDVSPATIQINDREIDFKAGLKAPVNANDLTLFPNPTTGILTIKSRQKIVDWRIYDSSGREVKVYKPIGAYEWTLSVADLPRGTYLVHLRGMKGGVSYGRFVRG